jgi:formylglycine-generating enzyme required for sulfatase activity/tRNA A-37 threonylcarbamoyl transferase component Bud32
MGTVYVAMQLSTGVLRALKVMRTELAPDARFRERFQQEARAAAQIPSDHVAQVLSAGVDEQLGLPYLAMELLDGVELERVVEQGGPLTTPQFVHVFGQLCHAVGRGHALGVVHRDLKAANVFLCRSRVAGLPVMVKVLDFGIAKLLTDAKTKSTQAMGTPLWVAPEQTEKRSEVTPATDVWAIGLLGFYVLTGKVFWEAAQEGEEHASVPALMREVLVDPIEAASARAVRLGSTWPRELDAWFSRCVARTPIERFASATAAFEALEEAAGTIDETSSPSVRKPVVLAQRVAELTATARAAGDDPAPAPVKVTEAAQPLLLPPMTTPSAFSAPHASDELAAQLSQNGSEGLAAPRIPPAPTKSNKLGANGKISQWTRIAIVSGSLAAVVTLGLVSRVRTKSETVAAGSIAPNPSASVSASTEPRGPTLARIPGGVFWMGSTGGDADERPMHEVRVATFKLDTTEVTVAHYRECVKTGRCEVPNGVTEDSREAEANGDATKWSAEACNYAAIGRDEHPMNCVDWNRAAAYCAWAGKRLPTEAEWEYAARSGDGRSYPWGNDYPSERWLNACGSECAAWMKDRIGIDKQQLYAASDGWPITAPVGKFPVSPWGLYDMAGNVWEWTSTEYCDSYGFERLCKNHRVIRGGSWGVSNPLRVRASNREALDPSYRAVFLGFRCASE